MTFFVGSTNPVKIRAVQMAVSAAFPDGVVKSFETQSGVNSQPMTDEETRLGAQNRAQQALKKGGKNKDSLGIGLEGGVFRKGDELWSTVWCAVADHDGKLYECNGARIKVPAGIAQIILAGKEMSHAVEAITGHENVKQKQGMIGIVTENFVDRAEEYGVLAKLAIGLWYGRDWEKSVLQPVV